MCVPALGLVTELNFIDTKLIDHSVVAIDVGEGASDSVNNVRECPRPNLYPCLSILQPDGDTAKEDRKDLPPAEPLPTYAMLSPLERITVSISKPSRRLTWSTKHSCLVLTVLYFGPATRGDPPDPLVAQWTQAYARAPRTGRRGTSARDC